MVYRGLAPTTSRTTQSVGGRKTGVRDMPKSSTTAVTVAIITGLGAILVALIQFHPWTKHSQEVQNHKQLILSGAVIDEATNRPIEYAEISLVGRPESYATEDNGNFLITLPSDFVEGATVRVRVTKMGYVSADRSFVVPSEGIVIAVQK
jgi:hypothetical protein